MTLNNRQETTMFTDELTTMKELMKVLMKQDSVKAMFENKGTSLLYIFSNCLLHVNYNGALSVGRYQAHFDHAVLVV